MNDVMDAIGARIKSPYFGYSVLAFVAFNWKGIFLLFTLNTSAYDRISAFDQATDFWTLIFFPLFIGALVAASTHWIRYGFEFLSKRPLELIENISLEAEHKKAIRHAELEQLRTELFTIKEEELISRAKRDEEVAEISDNSAKEKLTAQLEKLRLERDELSEQIREQKSNDKKTDKNISKHAQELLQAATTSEAGTIMKLITLGGRSIQAGKESFGSKSSREFVKYEEALEELIDSELVKERGNKGQIFEVTNLGWLFISNN